VVSTVRRKLSNFLNAILAGVVYLRSCMHPFGYAVAKKRHQRPQATSKELPTAATAINTLRA